MAGWLRPRTRIFYVVSKDLPAMLKLELDEAEEASATSSPEQRGRTSLLSNCRLCHGADLKGQPPAVPSLVDIGSRLSPKEIRAIVTQGSGPMPAFSKLSDAELDSLLAYLLNPSALQRPVTSAGATKTARCRRECPLQKRFWLHVYAAAGCLRSPRPGLHLPPMTSTREPSGGKFLSAKSLSWPLRDSRIPVRTFPRSVRWRPLAV